MCRRAVAKPALCPDGGALISAMGLAIKTGSFSVFCLHGLITDTVSLSHQEWRNSSLASAGVVAFAREPVKKKKKKSY